MLHTRDLRLCVVLSCHDLYQQRSAPPLQGTDLQLGYVCCILIKLIQRYGACRQLAVEAISAFAGRVGALSSLRDLFVRLQKLLDGSAEGKLRNAYERAGLTAAVGALCPAQSLAAGPRLGSKRQRHAGPGGSGTAEPDPDMAALAEDAADFVAGLCK